MKLKNVTAAILLHEGKVLVAQRKSGDPLALKWEFPGGKVEQGESPEECLSREILEELGIEATVLSHFADSVYTYPHGAIRLMAYWVRWTKGVLAPAVHESIRWVDSHELESLDFAPADIPLALELARILADGSSFQSKG